MNELITKYCSPCGHREVLFCWTIFKNDALLKWPYCSRYLDGNNNIVHGNHLVYNLIVRSYSNNAVLFFVFVFHSRPPQDTVLSGKPRRHVQWTTFSHQLLYFLIAARFSHRSRVVGHIVPVSVTCAKLSRAVIGKLHIIQVDSIKHEPAAINEDIE